jgi:hypothetical protein
MASDGQNPGQDLGALLESVGMLPHLEKGLTDQILGERSVVDHSEHVTKYAGVIPRSQRTHGLRVCSCDALDKLRVRT